MTISLPLSPMECRVLAALFLLACLCVTPASGEQQNRPNRGPRKSGYRLATKPMPESEARIGWFKDAKLGMFIHWGIYSTRGGIAPNGEPMKGAYTEWYQKRVRLNNKAYSKLAAEFNPKHFNADTWATIAKNAGMKYIIITAKHHDGFCIFDSDFTAFDIADATPFQRDPLMELREACDKHGLKLIYYYSHAQDWEQHHAWQTDKWIFPDMAGTPVDHEKYLTTKALPQVRELLTKYRADGIWFDTPRFAEEEIVPISTRFSELVRKTNPKALINSRITHISRDRALQGHLFDYISLGDQKVPRGKLPMYAEVPDSIHHSYGYDKRPNVHYKTAAELLPRVIQTVARNANSVINVGPTGLGEIPEQAQANLAEIGDWMKTHGEGVYGTQPTPYDSFFEWGEITMQDDTLYLHILDRTHTVATLPRLASQIQSATVLGSGEAVTFKQDGATATVSLPGIDGELPYVIRLKFDAPVTLKR
ncbi:MAG: hypothetical protein HN341_10480 [Verrucomicrobia bacterium]|nr:hypothetical protein [Verrucomicrobiota bacterium]